jgi:hypothetical protein
VISVTARSLSIGYVFSSATQNWEDQMLAYLRVITIAFLTATAIGTATVAPAVAIGINSFSFGALSSGAKCNPLRH